MLDNCSGNQARPTTGGSISHAKALRRKRINDIKEIETITIFFPLI